MTVKFFATMLMPDVQAKIYKSGKLVEVIKVKDIENSKHGDETVKDWQAVCFEPVMKIAI